MNNATHSLDLTLTPFDNRRLFQLCGQYDQHLKYIEQQMGVQINNRGNAFQIVGSKRSVDATKELLSSLYTQTAETSMITTEKIHDSLKAAKREQQHAKKYHSNQVISLNKLKIPARSKTQEAYIQNILNSDVNFGIGPAGTGKTFLAVACAVQALEQETVQRIVLVRPAVEAGERLGFLPGDLTQKIDPYLRPLYDGLYEMLGYDQVVRLAERNVIEVAPLAYMRGRTLTDSFIILDESQNTTLEQMKMFLTRIGFGSKAVITGDITQTDLPNHKASGLRHVISILKDIPKISFTFFESNDVVRHPVVQSIIEAYDHHESAE